MSAVLTFYNSVITEVIESLKHQFNEEGIDPAVLNELKDIWERKIRESGALNPPNHNVQPAAHFSNIMQQNDQQRINAARIPTSSNPTSRLIKPSGQGSVMQDPNFSASRVTVPILLPPGNTTFRQVNSFMNNMTPNNPVHDLYAPNYRMPPFQTCDILFDQWLKNNRLKNIEKPKPLINIRNDPVMINPAQTTMNMFSQYHNMVNPNNHVQHVITDNGTINSNTIRKNQVDGADDGSSDEESDFVNVSEVDPQSVRPPMSNVPATPTIFKKETKEDESEEDMIDGEIENMVQANISVKNEDSADEEEDDDDDEEADDAQNEEEPLNSGDDISDDDPERIFETDNVIVCQYEKVNRTRNKWKLNFVSGIANLHGKDSVFHKAVGEAEW